MILIIDCRYSDTQQFRAHYDWLDVNQGGYSVDTAGNRVTSFFVYLVANCTGGTTVFPQVDRPEGDAWCDTLKCKEDNGQEVEWLEVQGKVGRAIFWHNLDPYGNPDPDTLHAGTPVVHGTKVGLNIWTRENPYRRW
jgi:prolyl 4-hydroxylase